MMEKISKYLNLILAAAVVVLLLFSLKTCSSNANLKADIARGEQNQKALLDTVRVVKNKAGELQSEKLTLIATEKELRELNTSLAEEVKKQKGKVLQLTQANAELRTEIKGLKTELEEETLAGNALQRVLLSSGPIWPKTYRLKWAYDTTYTEGNYTRLAGFSRVSILNDSTIVPGLTDITENAQGFKLVTGLRKEGDDYHIFIKSDHPGFTVSNIDGAIIPGKNNPLFGKPKKWGLGVAVGPNFSYGYGIGGQGLFVGVGATFGLTYNIIKF